MFSALTRNGTVLVVDDQDMLRRLLRRFLVRDGHEVAEAASAMAALELCRRRPFEVVVSDVNMPEQDGWYLLRTLRLEQPQLPVIMMSGATDVVSSAKALARGALAYLPKPLDFDELNRLVNHGIAVSRRPSQAPLPELRPLPNRQNGKGRPVDGELEQE